MSKKISKVAKNIIDFPDLIHSAMDEVAKQLESEQAKKEYANKQLSFFGIKEVK